MLIAFGAVIGLMFKANESHNIIEVVDNSGLFKSDLKSTDKIEYKIIPSSEEQSTVKTLKSNETIDGILILPQIQNGNFDEFQKNTRLVVNTKIGFDTKQRIISDLSNVIKRKNKAIRNC